MIHHVSFGTRDVARARAFYDPLMQLLGMRMLKINEHAVHYGTGDIQFSLETPVDGRAASPGNGSHVAFQARDRAMVRKFHEIGLASGGKDAGAPDVRPNYDANYFAAFIEDPDGNKIEAVTFMSK